MAIDDLMRCERCDGFAEREVIAGARECRVFEVMIWKFAREGWLGVEPEVAGPRALAEDLARLRGPVRYDVRCHECGRRFLFWWDGAAGEWTPDGG